MLMDSEPSGVMWNQYFVKEYTQYHKLWEMRMWYEMHNRNTRYRHQITILFVLLYTFIEIHLQKKCH